MISRKLCVDATGLQMMDWWRKFFLPNIHILTLIQIFRIFLIKLIIRKQLFWRL